VPTFASRATSAIVARFITITRNPLALSQPCWTLPSDHRADSSTDSGLAPFRPQRSAIRRSAVACAEDNVII
jgi:hypothetical protein